MKYRVVFRVALGLVVAAAQVAGISVASVLAPGPETAAYFCCCVGECSCTGECCNHGPSDGVEDETPKTRIGSGGPALEAPTSCGVWRATLQRGPDQGKVFADDRGGRSTVPPASTRLRQFQLSLLVSLDGGFHPSSPRAPPSLPTLV